MQQIKLHVQHFALAQGIRARFAQDSDSCCDILFANDKPESAKCAEIAVIQR